MAAGSGELAARQAELVAALVAGAAPPVGLDGERVRVQAAALLRKRGRSVAHAQPDLAAVLGPGFGAAFLGYARGRTGPPPGCAADDAVEFARYLLGADGDRHPSAEVRRAARRVTRPALFRRGRLAGVAVRRHAAPFGIKIFSMLPCARTMPGRRRRTAEAATRR